jgi:hypothetical protein
MIALEFAIPSAKRGIGHDRGPWLRHEREREQQEENRLIRLYCVGRRWTAIEHRWRARSRRAPART